MAEDKKKKPKRVLRVIKKNLKGIHHVVWGKGKKKFFIAIGVSLAILFVLLVIALEVTSKPGFCATCHYMEPYYENWQNSSHSGVTCTDCHFPPGIKSKIEGKFTALSMLVNYFTGVYKKSKPRAEIEDASCLRGGCCKSIFENSSLGSRRQTGYQGEGQLSDVSRRRCRTH